MCIWNIVQALERKRIIYKNLKNCYCVTKCIFKGNQPFDPGNLSPNKLHSSENWNTKRSFFVILGWGRASENIANCKGKGYTSQEKVKNEFTKTLNANIWLLSSPWLVPLDSLGWLEIVRMIFIIIFSSWLCCWCQPPVPRCHWCPGDEDTGRWWQQTSAHPSPPLQNTTSINKKYSDCVPRIYSQPSSSPPCVHWSVTWCPLCVPYHWGCARAIYWKLLECNKRNISGPSTLHWLQNRNKLAFCFRSRTYPRTEEICKIRKQPSV